MISVIYGAKGSGKTKRIIDAANAAGESSTGLVVFITDNNQSLNVRSEVRFINLQEYSVANEKEFIGFIKGMLAANFDIQKVYIDSLSRLLGLTAEELKPTFEILKGLSENVDFVVTVSAEKLPTYLKKYAVKD